MLASSLWRPLCGALLIPLVCAQKHSLVQRAVTSSTFSNQATPTPLSVAASSIWDGPDGPWSSFKIRVGTPEQEVRVLISTAGKETWVVLPGGCLRTDTICPDARGGIYNNDTSSTWSRLGEGYFELSVEQNLNIPVTGLYGHDTIGLGGRGSSGPTLQNQIVAGIKSERYYLGMFGVNRKPTSFNGVDGEQPSYMSSLKNQGIIPSESFGYTAGAQYQLKKVLGSLTLGGYDESRFTPNELAFSFASGDSRDLVVGVQSITSTRRDGTVKSLLPSGILAYVDSTVPQIWLPIDACRAFEEAFGLVYDDESELYLINDTLHDALIAQGAVITFALGSLQTGGKTINITLPYDSFDLQATPPFVDTRTRYFPLQRAKNDTQYTLGRTFLQEAYLIVDWERRNFSLSQCLFKEDSPQKLVAIASVSRSSNSSKIKNSSSLSKGKKVGVGVGVTLGVLVAGILIFFFFRRRNQQNKPREIKKPEDDLVEPPRPRYEEAELNADNENAIHEKGDYENDQRRGQPKVLASPRSWDTNDELVSGGILPIGELSADHANRGLSPSEPLLGQVHELQDRPGSPANPYEPLTEIRSELPGSPPDKIEDGLAAPPPGRSPISQSSSSAPSDPTHGHLGTRRGARSSARRSLPTPSRPSRPSGAPSFGQENEVFNSNSPIGDQERGRGQGSFFSILRGFPRPTRPSRET